MKLKYYLRGVGAGLILAVLFYSAVIIPKKYQMTDEDIIKRAGELGMVEEKEVELPSPSAAPDATEVPEPDESPVTQEPDKPNEPEKPNEPDKPDASKAPDEPDAPTRAPEPTDEPGKEQPDAPTQTPEPTDEPGKEQPDTPTQAPEPTDAPEITEPPQISDMPEPTGAKDTVQPGQKISITVTKGMSSAQFSKLAASLGIVEDAEELDRYLIKNGYASDIMIGTYQISAGASYHEIAKIITAR